MPSPVQLPGPTRSLVRSLALVGRFPLSIDEMLAPVIQLADLSEEGPQPLVRRATAAIVVAAVALEGAVFRFETPTGIGARVRQLFTFDTTGLTRAGVFFGSSFPAPAQVAAKSYTDGRLRASGQQPAGVLVGGTQVAPLAVIHYTFPVEADPGSIYEPDWRVGRIDAFDFMEIKFGVVNSIVSFAMTWDEFEIR